MKWLLAAAMLVAGCTGAEPTPAPTLDAVQRAYLAVCPGTGPEPDWCRPTLLSTARVEPALPAFALLALLGALGFAAGLTYLRLARGAGYVVFVGGLGALLWIEGSLSSVHFAPLDVLHVAHGFEGIAAVGVDKFLSATGEAYGGTPFVISTWVALLLGAWASLAFKGTGKDSPGEVSDGD